MITRGNIYYEALEYQKALDMYNDTILGMGNAPIPNPHYLKLYLIQN
jgi:hypothetical protein